MQYACIFAVLTNVFASAGSLPSSSFQAVACPDSVVADRCGYIAVPISHSQPSSKKIKIFVAVKEAISTLKKSNPVFYLDGGPGLSASETLKYLVKYSLTDFDFVTVDFRGSPLDVPALNCPETSSIALLKCGKEWLSKGIKLNRFNSLEAAGDIEYARKALGYPKINIYAVSYGTILA